MKPSKQLLAPDSTCEFQNSQQAMSMESFDDIVTNNATATPALAGLAQHLTMATAYQYNISRCNVVQDNTATLTVQKPQNGILKKPASLVEQDQGRDIMTSSSFVPSKARRLKQSMDFSTQGLS